jgi:endoglucanase
MNLLAYNDSVILRDSTNRVLSFDKNRMMYFSSLAEEAQSLVIRPAFGDPGVKGMLPTNKEFHLHHVNSGLFLSSRMILGNDSLWKLFAFDMTDGIPDDAAVGLQSVSQNLMLNVTGIPCLSKGGSTLYISKVKAEKPMKTVWAINNAIRRGINYANALESPVGQDWGGLPVQKSDIEDIKAVGFTAIRLPVRWDDRCVNGIIPLTRLKEVARVVDWILDTGLYCMLNIHHFDPLSEDPIGQRGLLMSMIDQIGNYFQDYNSKLIFELCNEPKSVLNHHWNDILLEALNTFRKSNKTRICVIGPAGYNSRQWLSRLKLPEDRRVIVTVHYYEPMNFSMYLCPYLDVSGPTGYTPYWGKEDKEFQILFSHFIQVCQLVKEKFNMPINIGEYGSWAGALTYNSRLDNIMGASDHASRVRWVGAVVSAARMINASAFYFDYKSIWAFKHAGFGLCYNGQWNKPLLAAVMR